MSRPEVDEERALADRLVSYADAVVAVGLIGVSGLGLALADPDIRPDIARVATWVAGFNILLGAVFSAVLVLLRRWETDLRSELPPATKFRRYSRYLHAARLGLIWFAVLQTAALMLAIR